MVERGGCRPNSRPYFNMPDDFKRDSCKIIHGSPQKRMNDAENTPMLNFENLTELFEAHPGEATLNIQGKCIACERNLTVEICPTTDGFGFKGGMLLDKDQQDYVISCENCIHTATARH